MITTFIIIISFSTIASFLPVFNVSHWSFRLFDFIRIQHLILQVVLLSIGLLLYRSEYPVMMEVLIALFIAMIYQFYIIYPYLPIHSLAESQDASEKSLSVISVNVLQKNNNYDLLINLIDRVKPDILLTMETNIKWEDALQKIEKDFKYSYKIPLENRYGMHLYTHLKINHAKEHYFISDDRPAVEIHLEDRQQNHFVFWGLHPPPPSPTEKPTSKQKDGELMKAALSIKKHEKPSIVTGDFNNVSWSKSAKLFCKVSQLKDARRRNGIHGSFPARFPILRFPLDLVFHSKEIIVNEIKTLEKIGSDHLPVYVRFNVKKSTTQDPNVLEEELKEKAEEIIDEGEKAEQIEE